MILLDTHTWVWWVTSSARLSGPALTALQGATTLGVSAMTVWEVAMLAAHGRLTLDRDVGVWLDQSLALPGIRLIPLAPAIAVLSTRLPGKLHRDPVDRILAATAMHEGCPLVTCDGPLREYRHIVTVW